jgi:hypothetical protein
MFEFSNWQIEEPEIDDATKYDNLVPTVVKSPSSDLVRKNHFDINSINEPGF